MTPKDTFANPIQADVASCLKTVITTGLQDEPLEELFNKYPTPDNCKFFNPPSINPEVKVAVSEPIIQREARLLRLQKHIGTSLSAIGFTITKMLNEEGRDNTVYIQTLSDVGKLLSNVHHLESVSRKELIARNLNRDLKETLSNTPTGELLFGADLDTTIKSARELEKSGQQLKLSKKPVPLNKFTPRAQSSNPKNQENYRGHLFQKYGARKRGPSYRAQVPVNQGRRAQQFYKKRPERSDMKYRQY